MYKSKIDIAVLFLFFARPEQTGAVFEQIKIARPSKLFLYQDGPRQGRVDDIENIRKCREIVEQIDWECEVHRMYQEQNYGCDPSEYISQKWMFEHVEQGIVLEDDDVPSQSFFPFCKELLEKYKDDTRINIICGMNNCGTTDTPYSYLFTRYGSIWGWATWKRVIDMWDSEYQWLNDAQTIEDLCLEHKDNKSMISICREHLATGREHYESILGSNARLNHMLNIVPARNLITNIGIAAESTHSVSSLSKLPRSIRRVFNMKRYEVDFPLKHPKYVIENAAYKKEFESIMNKKPFKRFLMRLEGRIYKLFPRVGK